ncbi:helix-turn-helix domain-containing protein [Burkholderia alba]|uniref:helix-turn-helix domain-containing protein n=1 Tax=Burkholderia alba TaxID=2683677 RepID=UPI002B056729|nr:cupin domain-containing protein [Burkholderia alba]
MVLQSDESVMVAVSIGNKIRALRQRLRLTLDEAAAAAGISKPFLSQVERGRATPSITSLVGIAKALGVTMQYFVDTPTEAKSVCRGNTLQYFSFANSTSSFARLTNLADGRKLDAILVRMPVGKPPSEVTTHAGEEFLYVMAGEVALTLEGRTFNLKAGDTAHYESTVPHAWGNTADEEAVIVWVGTPRLF